MDDRLKETDRAVISGLSHSPPRRKGHSYSQQLRTTTETYPKRNRNKPRHFSLDDSQILADGNPSYNNADSGLCYSSDDDDFCRYTPAVATAGDGEGSDGNNPEDGPVSNEPLPDFMGNGGGVGVFKPPHRSAVHPSRPPCHEHRPHPLRETQSGKCIRTIASTETQLWAGQESGVRVWKYTEMYEPGNAKKQRRGDEDTSPFYESATTSPVFCMMFDQGNKLVWTGHKDGKIRSWKTEQNFSYDTAFKEGFSWQAHRNPILSMTMSFYGDMWAGSEGGVIKFWPWESIEKSLSLSAEERHMAALLVERAGVDLRAQVTVNGVCNISLSDVKYLLSDNIRAKIWAVGSVSFSLWNARTKELLKVFNIDGQIENRADMPSSYHDQAIEDEINAKYNPKAKKEKPQGFLQRSRNAILGAADAVRRAAKGAGALVEDIKKTEAIVLAADGVIWTGCSNGLLIQWDGNGNRLQDFSHHSSSVHSLCSHGSRMWVGYASGILQVLDIEGNIIAGWVCHNEPVIKLIVSNSSLFSLATHGGIRGWNISSPALIDNVIRKEITEREQMYTRTERIRMLVGTWNVGQGKASHGALMAWLGSAVSDVDIVVVGLQEVEMGAGFLAMSAAKETVGLEGSSLGQWWQDHIGKALDEGSAFERVGSRQLAALLIAIWVRKNLRKHVGDLDVGAVACGLGRAIGNKGGVGLRLRVFDRIMCFSNCHFAAHLEAVNRRNADFDHIFRTMTFSRSSNHFNNSTAGGTSNNQAHRGQNPTPVNTDDGKPDLAEADLVVFSGDFNYRLFGITYDEARDLVSQRSFDWLREKDQLRAEMKAGKVFQGMREALIKFPPTYKFEKGKPGLGGYDSGEKKRIPAWCDRVLFRDTRGATPVKEVNLDCPVIASVLQYEACMEVVESDHKPVRCKLTVDIAHVDKTVRRQEYGKILESNETIRSNLDALRFVPETSVNTDGIALQNHEPFSLKITNQSATEVVFFQIICEGQKNIKDDNETPANYRFRGNLSFPRWLEVTSAAGMIRADQVAEISVRHEDDMGEGGGVPPSWWSEDTKDKEVILLVMIRGSCSTEPRIHRISIRHSFTGSARPPRKRQDQRPPPSR